MVVFYENIIDRPGAEIIASSTYSTYPLSNLFSDRLCELTKLGPGEQYIQISLNNSVNVDSVCLAGCNFSNAILQASNDSFQTIIQSHSIIDAKNKKLISCFQTIYAKDFRIIIDTADAKNIGKLFIGKKTQLPGMEISQKIKISTSRKNKKSLSGQIYRDTTGFETTGFDCSFPYLTDIETFGTIRTFWNTVLNQKTFFTYLWSEKSDIKLPLMYGTLDQTELSIERNESKKYPHKVKLTFEECF